MDKFCDILNDLILETGLSLRKLASASGISATQYSKYLRGSIPTIEVAIRLSNYFKCSLDYLFGIEESDKKFNLSTTYDMSKFLIRYNKVLNDNKITHWIFCKKYGLGESCIRGWKKGQIPAMESLITIAKNLSTSIDYLIGRSDK